MGLKAEACGAVYGYFLEPHIYVELGHNVALHGKSLTHWYHFSAPKPVGKHEFSDILNAQGFKATSDQEAESQTLSSLKKEQNKPDDPIKAKVILSKYKQRDNEVVWAHKVFVLFNLWIEVLCHHSLPFWCER